MTHVTVIDDSLSPSKGQEIFRPVTILVFPKVFVYGARFYKKDYIYEQAVGSVYDKALATKLGMKAAKSTNFEEAKKKASEYTDVTALAFADPSELGIGIKKQMRFEFPVGGSTIEEKFAFIEKIFGKEIKPSEVMAPGEFIDVVTVSKGKGWEGPIHRFGVARQFHKSTGKIRHVGTLGAWHPPKVLFSVPQAGHLGFNYRTELNKRIMKMGTAQDGASVTSKGGILAFGTVRSDYMLIDGSLPGGAKRFVRIRKAIRSKGKVSVPKIVYISTESKQGA
jgi:large subunit ribosomal protein L3